MCYVHRDNVIYGCLWQWYKISMKTHDTPGYELKILHVDSCAAGEYSHEKPSLFQALSQCGCSQCALWVQVYWSDVRFAIKVTVTIGLLISGHPY